jgi:hypothetical protein
MLSGEDILLNSEEEHILSRWEFASKRLEEKMPWNELRQALVDEYAISRYTAENDIAAAQEIFGRTRRISKRFLLHLQLERLDQDIEKYRKSIFTTIDKETGAVTERNPDEKEMAALARMHDVYVKALDAIPEDISKTKMPPPVFVFQLPEGQTLQPTMSFADAMKAAEELIEDLNQNEDGSYQRPTSEEDHDATAAYDDPDGESE